MSDIQDTELSSELKTAHDIQLWLARVTREFAKQRDALTLVDLSDLDFLLDRATLALGVQTAETLLRQLDTELAFWDKFSTAYKDSFTQMAGEGGSLNEQQLQLVCQNIDDKQALRLCIYTADRAILNETLALTDLMYEVAWSRNDDGGFRFTGDDAAASSKRYDAIFDAIQRAESIHQQSLQAYQDYIANKDKEQALALASQFMAILKPR